MSKSIRFYFSFRSPFAAIAIYRMRRLAMFKDFEIDLIPVWPEIVFGGHMDNPTDNIFKVAYVFVDAARQTEDAGLDAGLMHAFANNLKPKEDIDLKAEKAGLKMPPENWPITHHAFLYAKQQGQGWAFADKVSETRFAFQGHPPADVTNRDVLSNIATELGLDANAMLAAHDNNAFDEQMQRYIKQSEIDGVFGVPFFVFEENGERQAFWGNDHIEPLYKALTGKKLVIEPTDLQTVLYD